MRLGVEERVLHFRQPAGTSRGVYTTRRSWFVTVETAEGQGVGECAPLPDLSCDASPDYGERLRAVCESMERTGQMPMEQLLDCPSMLFGLETALRNIAGWDDTPFARGQQGIPINGLVWMGTYEEMRQRLEQKLSDGYRCVKLKIGAIDFDSELALIKRIRRDYGSDRVELRLDANGAFAPEDALARLEQLAPYDIHSIEQPIRQGQWGRMAELCRQSPIPIALDEELIGVNDPYRKTALLDTIHPQYIILKPSLHGGMLGTRQWIGMARERGIGSWMTSALESNIGLEAIARWADEMYGPNICMPQGLGTGALFTDNFPTTLRIAGDKLWLR